MNRAALITLLAIPVFSFNAQAAATAYTRALNADGAWFAAGAWNGSTWINPTAGNTATAAITTSGGNPLTLTLDQAVTLNGLSLAGAADLTLAGQALSATTTGAFAIPSGKTFAIQAPFSWTTSGTVTLSNGTLLLSGPTQTLALASVIQMNGGCLEFASGTVSIRNDATNGNALNMTNPASEIRFTGNANVTISAKNAAILTQGGAATAAKKATFRLKDSAKVTISGGAFYMGASTKNAQSDFIQDGGEFNMLSSGFRIGHNSPSDYGAEATYTMNRGNLNVPNTDLEVGRDCAGALIVNDGNVQARRIYVGINTQTGRVQFNGGTITLGPSGINTPKPANATLDLGAATLATFPTNSWAMTDFASVGLTSATPGTIFVPAAGQTIALSSPLTGAGRLVLDGEGTLLLNAASANTFTGGLEIRKGTLAIGAANQVPA